MPRRARPDLKPEIWIDDTTAEENALRAYVPSNRIVRVYEKNSPDLLYIVKFAHLDLDFLDDLLHELGPDRKYFNGAVAFKLMTLVRRSRIEPVRNNDLSFVIENGKQRMRLEVLGCRARYGTQEHLGYMRGRDRSYIVDQFRLMKQVDIITNHGNGWVDFNADMFWKGKHQHQIAYVNEYPQPPYIEVFPKPREDDDE